MMRASLTLGIGCRRQVSPDAIEQAVRKTLPPYTLADVRQVATLQSKTGEPGLQAFCRAHALPLRGIAIERITALTDTTHPSCTHPSVMAALGVLAVCEPCAILAASGGRLLVGKTVHGGVTVAIATDTLSAVPTV